MDTTFTGRLAFAIKVALIACLLTGCNDGPHYAPVTDIDAIGQVLQKHSPTNCADEVIARPLVPAPVQQQLPRKRSPARTAYTPAWIWPAQGKVILPFSSTSKGIDIAALETTPIVATADGKVVYSGNGLRGYGNLIIIKHNKSYFSAYAHNRAVFVKDGEWVEQGQKIAEMGHTGTDHTILHFEIRKAGKAIDPVSLLSS